MHRDAARRITGDQADGCQGGGGYIKDAGGALDMKSKEFIFALLDVLAGNAAGAKSHGLAAMKLGLTVPEMAEGLVQVIMVGGITTWNLVGADLLRACVAEAADLVIAPTG